MTSQAKQTLHVSGLGAPTFPGASAFMFPHLARTVLLATLMLSFAASARAQTTSAAGAPGTTEVVSGGYVIHQSMELGVRVSDPTGSAAMYDTLVDLHSGPRVLDQMLSMRSENH